MHCLGAFGAQEGQKSPEVGISLSERKRIREREDELKSLILQTSVKNAGGCNRASLRPRETTTEMMRKNWLLLENSPESGKTHII